MQQQVTHERPTASARRHARGAYDCSGDECAQQRDFPRTAQEEEEIQHLEVAGKGGVHNLSDVMPSVFPLVVRC